MRLKFYLRGIGIGIIVTAIILHFTLGSSGQEMSDEQIKQRALELGMIENTVLKTDKDTSVSADAANASDKPVNVTSVSSNTTDNNKPENSNTENSKTENSNTENSKDKDSKTEVAKADDTKTDDSKIDDTKTDAAKTDDLKSDDSKTDTAKTDTVSANNSTTDDEKDKTSSVSGNQASTVSIVIYAGDGSFAAAKRAYDAGLVDSAAEFDMFLCQNGYDKKLTVGDHKVPVGASEEEIAKILTSATR